MSRKRKNHENADEMSVLCVHVVRLIGQIVIKNILFAINTRITIEGNCKIRIIMDKNNKKNSQSVTS
jgi:hypothetical protein